MRQPPRRDALCLSAHYYSGRFLGALPSGIAGLQYSPHVSTLAHTADTDCCNAVEPGQPPLEGRLIQCFLYTRTPGMAEDNHYAHPLDMVVNLDLNSRRARVIPFCWVVKNRP